MPADPDLGFDVAALDLTRIVADAAAVREINPHRHEMELVSAVVHIGAADHTVAGYLDLPAEPFWARGHFPRFPVMPGVLMIEAAAQVSNYYTVAQGFVPRDRLIGLAGFDEVRYRGMVRPGDRLVIACRGLRVSPRMTKFLTKGFVPRGGTLEPAFEATVLGVPLGKWEDLLRA